MDGPRTPSAAEAPHLIDFLDQHLRPQSDWSIRDEYPTTFSEGNLKNLHIIKSENEVLSHAATRYLLLKTSQMTLKVAAIGSVVTSDRYRKQGHSRTLLQSCLDKAEQERADIAILWTDLYDFYRKMQFELAGSELSFLIDDELNVPEQNLTIREGANVSAEALLRVYHKHTATSFRTVEDVRQYLKIPNARIYTAWDRQGFLQAYAVEGKGADLDGYVHEWGGGVSQLMALFAHIRRAQDRPLTIIAPVHSQGLAREFAQHKIQCHHGHLGMIRVVRMASVQAKVQRYASAMGLVDFVFEETENGVRLGIGKDTLELKQPGQVVRFLFGPGTGEMIRPLPVEVRQKLQTIFPMHLWIWGWDSI